MIRKEKEMGKHYISTLSTKFNPDVLIGSAFGKETTFMKGNEYYSSKVDLDFINKRKKKQAEKEKELKKAEKKLEESEDSSAEESGS